MSENRANWQVLDTGLQAILTEKELAMRWGKSVRTLQRWRAAGVGPAYMQIGGSARYRVDQVLAFENANLGGADSQGGE